MRILHIVSTFPPYQGGMGNFAYQMVKKLANLDYSLTVITPTINKKDDLFYFDPKIKRIYLKPVLKYRNASFLPQIIKYLKNFEIIHLHWPFIGTAEIVLLYCLFFKKPKLIVQYQMDLIGTGFLKFLFKIYQFFILPLMVKVADIIIVSSSDYALNSNLEKFFKKFPEKFREIPLGVDTKIFFPKDKKIDLFQRYNLNFKNKIILFVGSLDKPHYFKGVDILLKAFSLISKKFSDVYLIIVGEGNLKSKYEKLAKKLLIDKKTIFTGLVKDKDLIDYYNLADIFVLPSIDRSEAFGLVLIEAMACGKPVIASNLSGVRTLIEDNINGFLFKIGEFHDLAKKLEILLENENLIKKFGEKGRKKVEEKYNLDLITKEFEKVYENVKI